MIVSFSHLDETDLQRKSIQFNRNTYSLILCSFCLLLLISLFSPLKEYSRRNDVCEEMQYLLLVDCIMSQTPTLTPAEEALRYVKREREREMSFEISLMEEL